MKDKNDEIDRQTESLLNKFNLWRKDHISERQFILLLSLVVGVFTAFAALLLKYLISLIHGFVSGNLFISQENYSLLVYIWNEVSLEFSEIDVQCTIETKGSSKR